MAKRSKTKRAAAVISLPLAVVIAAASSTSCTQRAATVRRRVRVDVEQNIQRLLAEEDTDGDKKITIDDHFVEDQRGDKKFHLIDNKGKMYEIEGAYHLSNLLQELTLSKQKQGRTALLDTQRIFENPVRRISRSIREVYWDGLTRRIDEENIVPLFADTKAASVDGCNYIYVPSDDSKAYQYFAAVADRYPSLKIKVVRLPQIITPEWVRSRNDYPGLLSLALVCSSEDNCRGVPFVVPGGRFNEMYGWDSYFEALGLLEDGRRDLAKAMVDNFVYEINYYGKILNANRSYYLTRSQPPFLTSMALAVYKKMPKGSQFAIYGKLGAPKNPKSKRWLRTALQAAIQEYNKVWMNEDRLTETGLSRYYGAGKGQPPEVEPGHFDTVYKKFAEKLGMAPAELEKLYTTGKIDVPQLDKFFTHDRAMRESGHDKTYRWDDRCADFVTVDLSSLLYKIETDIARTIEKEFNDRLKLEDGTTQTSSAWYEKAKKRKELMNRYLWDSQQGLFLDYDTVNKQRKVYISATVFYPLWANMASEQQAESIIKNALPKLEMPGGITASTEDSRGPLSESRPARQWDYPNGWAPHQMLAWQGLINYGYDDIADQLIYRWLYTITRNAADYNGTIPEKFDVVKRTHRVFAEYGNVGTKFSYITKEGFGWVNASYQVGLKMLPAGLEKQLEQLTQPEQIFE
jgi:alpha,alpha-trehalase